MFYIAFNKRSSVTARLLCDFLNENGVKCRMINSKKFKHKPSLLLRWGNSYLSAPEGCEEINSIEAVKRASSKLLMAHTLINAEGVNFPPAYISPLRSIEIANALNLGTDQSSLAKWGIMENGMELYYRNSSAIVRRRNNYIEGDLYGTKPIDRAREFRVHVFDGKTIGVYEKVPNDPDQPYCKNDNCDFKRIDMNLEENRSALKGVRPMARTAVKSLGLVFGGVDVIISKTGEVFVNEVNSAPALNGPNLERYFEAINNYLNKDEKEEAKKEDGNE